MAEDHEDTRALLRTLLERRGLTVVEARDGAEACDAAAREHPDLILMDGGLPVLDGVSATRRLRGLDSLACVPIVFLSGHAGPQHQLAARDAGCDDYVVKPFDLARLDRVLNRHLPPRAADERRGLRETPMVHSTAGNGFGRDGASPAQERGATRKMFGLIEIDAEGTVLYTRFEGGDAASFAALNMTGRNFYTEVAPFSNVGEFRQRLDSFSRGTQAAHSINFTCDYADGPVPVRILLARIRERSERDATKSVLVHIRQAL